MTIQEEYKYLNDLENQIESAMDTAAHFLGMGTPTFACTRQEVIDKLYDRTNELKDLIKQGENHVRKNR